MIGSLRGTLLEKRPNQVLLEVGGVGYVVQIPLSTFTSLAALHSENTLLIHTHVREDALALYGFLTLDEKALFEKLIGVSGIGHGLADKVLSGMPAGDLLNASVAMTDPSRQAVLLPCLRSWPCSRASPASGDCRWARLARP